jgi:hypothetical protein
MASAKLDTILQDDSRRNTVADSFLEGWQITRRVLGALRCDKQCLCDLLVQLSSFLPTARHIASDIFRKPEGLAVTWLSFDQSQ